MLGKKSAPLAAFLVEVAIRDVQAKGFDSATPRHQKGKLQQSSSIMK
jgi:hypothetical protein